MAIFDSDTQRIVVRVVYDGPAGAGKTTNVRQLCGFFTSRRRSELFVPEEVDGRTMYFDWLQLEGGVVCGHPLRCQMLTIAGQRELAHRRSRVLQTADVVVFVCESTPVSLVRARAGLETLRAFLRTRIGIEPPIIVQANKQDLPDALPPEEIASALGLAAATQVVPARASEGVGVRETAVLAIRAAANDVQRVILERGLASIECRGESAEEFYESMKAAEPASALPLDWYPRLSESPPAVLEATASEAIAPTEAAVPETPALEPVAVEPTAETNPTSVVPESSPVEPEVEATPPSAVPHDEPANRPPPLPSPDVPSGFIWPAATGRDVLRRLSVEGLRSRQDLVAQRGGQDGSGTDDLILFECDGWCLKTSPRRRFRDADEARDALLRAARSKISLGTFRLANTVLVAQPGEDGAYWLWTVTPWVTTLRAQMIRANAANDEASLSTGLERYAQAVIDAMQLAVRSGVALDLHPSNLATVDGDVVYVDDDVTASTTLPTIGYALLHRVEEYGHRPGAIDAYFRALETGLQSLTEREVDHLDLAGALREAVVRSSAAEPLRQRLLAVVTKTAI